MVYNKMRAPTAFYRMYAKNIMIIIVEFLFWNDYYDIIELYLWQTSPYF